MAEAASRDAHAASHGAFGKVGGRMLKPPIDHDAVEPDIS
jgi:hypothetical protein